MGYRENKRKRKKKKRFRVVILIIALSVVGVLAYGNAILETINNVKITKEDEKLGIKPKEDRDENGNIRGKKDPKDDVINIALFGGDRRQKNDVVHSDSIMILSIDKVHKKVKLSSIMRDTYVNVYGHGMTKINHAYAYGGPELAIRTLNENFDLNIRDYAFVDFYGFEKLIDALDGIDVEVKKSEVKEINKYIKEFSNIKGTNPTYIKSSGFKHLNGEQALSYSRIRKVGGGDFERTDRQRRVMTLIFDKVKSAGVSKYPSMVESIFPNVETSLSKMDIVKLGTYALTCDIDTIEQNRFPMDEHCKDKKIDGVYYLVTDLGETQKQIHKFIYDDIEECKVD